MNEFDDLLQLYKTKFNGYCLYGYEKWQHAHLSEYREEYKLNFEFHDNIKAASLSDLIIEADKFKELIECGIINSENFEYKGFTIVVNELVESGLTATMKSDERELTFTPQRTFSMGDAVEKIKIFIDGVLA